MNKPLQRWIVSFAFLLPAPMTALAQQQPQPQQEQLASVTQLESEAFKALKGGEFDRSSELITKAASISKDENLAELSQSMQKFETQRQAFAGEKQKGYDKAVDDIHKLLDKGYDDAAFDRVRDANFLAADKDAFVKEAWVADLIGKAKERAEGYAKNQQWIKAQRLYSDMSAIDTGNAIWKEQFKAVTTRLRLLAMYTPDTFKQIIDDETKQREAADQLINPSTQPATPATKPADDNDSFKTDWHDMLKGVRMDMLVDALDDARGNYWRDVSYKTMTLGGLSGLRALAETKGLEKTFTNLSDQTKHDKFIAMLDNCEDEINKAAPSDEDRVMHRIFDRIQFVNTDSVQFPEEVLTYEFADGSFAELDPFSTMIWPSDLEEFNKQVQGEYSGVGIQIQLDEDGNLKVVSPLEDSPAYRMHIKPGDVITRIDGKNAKGISINEAVKHITGTSGSTITLTIKSPDGTVKDYPIRREMISVASVKGYHHLPGGGWDYYVDPQQKIAYVRITNFTKTTDEELTKSLHDMTELGAKAIIIDLRNNPGGLLTAATDVCDKFLSGGTIVSTKGERDLPGQPPIEAKPSPDDIDLPLAVLVNQFSASASEIVSGALQDDKRAVIVGERTFGKGSVQMMFPLAAADKAALKLTTSHYYLPSGRCIHKEDNSTTWGVDPDVKIEMTGEQMRAAQEARINMEVLREDGDSTQASAPSTQPTTNPAKNDLLATDPQLSAAVLLLKLELTGATM